MSPANGHKIMVSGVQQVAGADAERRRKLAETEWPFPWVDSPLRSNHLFRSGFIVAPAPAAGITEILEYRVDDGFNFYLTHLVLQVMGPPGGGGGPFAWAPGDFTFQVDVNSPIGVAPSFASPFTDYVNVQLTLGGYPGAPLTDPWFIEPGEFSMLHERDVLRAKVTNVNIAPGAPQYFVAAFLGRRFPSGGSFEQ